MVGLFAIDDHFLIIEGLYKTFDPGLDDMGLVGSANNVEDAIAQIASVKPDIIVLDLFIGDADPVANFRQLRKHFPVIPIVTLTMEDSLRWQIKMFKLGVMGFLNKDDKKETLISVLHQVAKGNLVISEKVSRALISKTLYSK
jgi:DNA-binding NarL/FixJ family response regulator